LQPGEYEATIAAQGATIQAQQLTLEAMQLTLEAMLQDNSAPIPTIDPLLLPVLPTGSPSPTPTVLVIEDDGCLRHVVQGGDTVSAIAQQYGVSINDIFQMNGIGETTILQIGDELIIPIEGCAIPATATPTPTGTPVQPTPTPFNLPSPGPSATPTATPLTVQVEIVSVSGAGNVSNEVVEITNLGDVINLQGWQLINARSEFFRFPEFRFSTGSTIRVYSRRGANTPSALYWGRTAPAWYEGERITLLDSTRQEQASLVIGEE
jgi:LysM repeat protein